jgi:SAM-dependent methyltransferase
VLPDEVKARQAAIWGSGCYEPIAAKLASMHDALVRHLEPQAGERWLDVATGTGAVAERAAARGAEVTGIDIAPPLVETARRLARENGLEHFQEPPAANVGRHFDWGREAYVIQLLGEAFELEFDELDCPYTADSGADAWAELSFAYGPTKALADSLDEPRRDELRRTIVEFYEQLRVEGGVSHSRTYLLVAGRKREDAS